MAVVCLREDTGRDYVRTYHAAGSNIIWMYEPKGIVSKTWSISDTPQSYGLFYCRLDIDLQLTDVTNHPEVAVNYYCL